MRDITEWQALCHQNAVSKGWWDEQIVNIPEKLCLIHSEVSEALEDFRNGDMTTQYTNVCKPVGFPTELADIVIRCFDLAGRMGIDLGEEIQTKHEYNCKRPYRHGGKKC